MILYGLLIVVLGVAGYYVGRMYAYPMTGAGIGLLVGLIAVGVLYKYMGESSSIAMY